MTLGITGVVWLPRTATVNSTTLWAGAGPVPLSAAAPAWTQISAAYADASLTLTRVMAELAVGWQGVTAAAALTRFGQFKVWADQAAATAATLATKTAANSVASTTARVVMPSLPEIAAVQTAKVVAYSTGGVLNGTAEAAEAADRAMDIRAAIVMEAYEAATTTVVVTPTEFVPPPPLANGAGAPEAGDAAQAGRSGEQAVVDPVRAAGMAAAAFVQNPAVQTAAAQVGQVAGAVVSTAASTAVNVGTSVIGPGTGGSVSSGAPFIGAPMLAGRPDSSYATRSVGYGGGAGGNAGGNAGGVLLPEGWGQNAQIGSGNNVAAGVPGGGVATQSAGVGTPVTVDPNRGAIGPMVGQPRAGSSDSDEQHETPAYLKKFEHFADGRTVIPSVIGAEPEPVR